VPARRAARLDPVEALRREWRESRFPNLGRPPAVRYAQPWISACQPPPRWIACSWGSSPQS